MADTYIPDKPCKRGHYLRYLKGGICVVCARERAKRWAEENRERKAQNMLQWQGRNRQKVRDTNRQWQQENREKAAARMRRHRAKDPAKAVAKTLEWQKRNPGKACALVARRRARKLQATPAWLTPVEIQEIQAVYDEAARLTRETGVQHHVDHIVPLKGKEVSGLHVPWNLQVLTASDNCRKQARL